MPSEYDSDLWGTPSYLTQQIRGFLEGIDLDPASSEWHNLIVQADRYYSEEDNGLLQPWKARSLYLNPPYKQPKCKLFVGKFIAEYRAEQFKEGLLLINTATDATHFKRLLAHFPVAFRKRINFNHPELGEGIANRYSQALFYAGNDARRFYSYFEPLGWYGPVGTVLAMLQVSRSA